MRVSPANAAINSDRAIAGKQTGALLPCQERSASHRPARSNYPLKTEFPRPSLSPPCLAADARPQPSARNVRFGHLQTLGSRLERVRFTPETGHWLTGLGMSAKCQFQT